MQIVLSLLLWGTYILSLYCAIFWFLVFFDGGFDLSAKKRRIKLKKIPFVSIIIPAFNEQSTVVPTIKSCIALKYPNHRYEIIVVNDGSKDKTQERIEQFKRETKFTNLIIINQINQGKAQSLNNALKIAKGEFFACLDADSFVEPTTLIKMLEVYETEKDSSLSIVTPHMKIKETKKLVHKLQWVEYLVSMFIARLMSVIDCLYVAPGPFSVYRTKTIIEIGGFDSSTLTEDQEIAYRVQSRNLKLKQCPDAFVYTHGPATFKGLYDQRNRWFKGGLQNLWKYRSILMNKAYGDFGVAQMSINVLGFFLCFSSIFFFSYYMVWPLVTGMKHLFLVNFDILPFLHNISFSFNPLAINIDTMLIFYLLFIISFALLYLAHKNAGESMKTRGFVYLVPYFLVYYLVLSFIAVITVVELAVNKKQKW